MKRPPWYNNPMYSTGKLPPDIPSRWSPLPAVPLHLFLKPIPDELVKVLSAIAELTYHFPFDRFEEALTEVENIAEKNGWKPDAPTGLYSYRWGPVEIVVDDKADVIEWDIKTWCMPVAEYIGTRVYARVRVPRDLVEFWLNDIKTVLEVLENANSDYKIHEAIKAIIGDSRLSLLYTLLDAYEGKP